MQTTTVTLRIPQAHRDALDAEAEWYDCRWTDRARLAIAEHVARSRVPSTACLVDEVGCCVHCGAADGREYLCPVCEVRIALANETPREAGSGPGSHP